MAPKDESAAVNNNWEAVKSGGVAVKSQCASSLSLYSTVKSEVKGEEGAVMKSQCASSLTLYSTVKSEVKGEEGAVKDEVVTGEGVAKDGQRGAKNGEAGAEHGAKPSIAYAMHVHDPEQSRLAVAHARVITRSCQNPAPSLSGRAMPNSTPSLSPEELRTWPAAL